MLTLALGAIATTIFAVQLFFYSKSILKQPVEISGMPRESWLHPVIIMVWLNGLCISHFFVTKDLSGLVITVPFAASFLTILVIAALQGEFGSRKVVRFDFAEIVAFITGLIAIGLVALNLLWEPAPQTSKMLIWVAHILSLMVVFFMALGVVMYSIDRSDEVRPGRVGCLSFAFLCACLCILSRTNVPLGNRILSCALPFMGFAATMIVTILAWQEQRKYTKGPQST